ncbi:MAG: BrnT family toxin [Candidatus Rokubacteria bacterium]|nr:BrnT family toxin [Candidatus Rokubacteria bacterium]
MFEWDARKAAANSAKHGVSFEEAGTVFGDPDALDGPDLRHSGEESRFLRRHQDGESIRIISARRASRKERAAYAAED